MRSRPWIAVYWAITLALAGQIEGVNELLEDVEKLSADRPDANALIGYAAAIRAYLANLQGEPERTFSLAALSSEYLSDEHINARTMASYALADAHFALDNLPQAEEAYQEMLRMGEKSGQVMFIVSALCELASLRKAQGRLQAAADLYAQAWDQMVELNGLGTRLRCHYEFGLADLLYEWNQLDEAYAHAMKGMDIRSRLGGYYVIGDVPLMQILQARGDSKGALSVLREVDQVVSSAYIQLSGRLTLRAARVIEYLAVGDKERARSFSKQCSGKTDLDILARSSVLLAGERYKQMLELLNPQIQSARTGERTARLIALLCHRALAHEGLGEGQDAEDSIVVALSLARPEGFIRSFLDIDASLARLIQRVIRNYRTKSPDASPINQLVLEYASSLLSAFAMDRDRLKDKVAAMAPRPQPEGEADPLTERELEVLLLLAGGLSNKDLASRLFVAPSTIKQHLKNIYAKLGVHSRTEAVARARELNLLI
jgi:LuxR family maltose regulon positive regulatory protein